MFCDVHFGSPTGTTFDDTTAAVGATYYYWLKACNEWGCSELSNHDTGQRGDLFLIHLPVVLNNSGEAGDVAPPARTREPGRRRAVGRDR